MPMLSRTLEETLHRAIGYARERNHEYATLEHLLLALGDDSDAIAVLRACAVDVKKLRADVAEYVESEFETVDYDDADAPDPKPTAGFQRVLQRAAIHVQSSGREEVNGANVLVAIFSERESHAVYFLHLQEMTRLDAVQYISHGVAKAPGRSERRRPNGEGSRRASEPNGGGNGGDEPEDEKVEAEALEAYCVDLNEKAADGKIDPLIGRGPSLSASSKFYAAAPRIIPCWLATLALVKPPSRKVSHAVSCEGDTPEVLAHCTIYSLDLGALLAGTRYRGDFEERIKAVLKSSKNAQVQSCSSTKSTRSSVPVLHPAGPWMPPICSSQRLPRARSAASGPRPTRNTALTSRRTAPWCAGSRRSM